MLILVLNSFLLIWRYNFGLWKYKLNSGDFFMAKGEWMGLLGSDFQRITITSCI